MTNVTPQRNVSSLVERTYLLEWCSSAHPLPVLFLVYFWAWPRPRGHYICPQTMKPQGIKHVAVTEGPIHWSFSSWWEVVTLEQDMAGLLDPDNPLWALRGASGSLEPLCDLHCPPRPARGGHSSAAASAKPTEKKGLPSLASDFSHLITWFPFPTVMEKMELHHAPQLWKSMQGF